MRNNLVQYFVDAMRYGDWNLWVLVALAQIFYDQLGINPSSTKSICSVSANFQQNLKKYFQVVDAKNGNMQWNIEK